VNSQQYWTVDCLPQSSHDLSLQQMEPTGTRKVLFIGGNMQIFTLSQKVTTSINSTEWIDIASNKYENQLREFAKKIKKSHPDAILSLRLIEETELTI